MFIILSLSFILTCLTFKLDIYPIGMSRHSTFQSAILIRYSNKTMIAYDAKLIETITNNTGCYYFNRDHELMSINYF